LETVVLTGISAKKMLINIFNLIFDILEIRLDLYLTDSHVLLLYCRVKISGANSFTFMKLKRI
jgi:hypothetical protein